MAIKEAVVKRIEKNYIILSPIIADKCINCTQKCLLRGRPFKARNKRNLSLKVGSLVSVGTTNMLEAFLGVFCLVIPVICAFLGYIISKNRSSESEKAIFILIFLLSSTILLFILNRTLYSWYKPEIIEVL